MNGRSVYPVVTETKKTYQSISKVTTVTPPSCEKMFIFAQLSKNLENACIKTRRYNLAAARLVIFLRKQDFRSSGVELKLDRPTAYPTDLFAPLKEGFDKIYRPDTPYRQTGVVLTGLVPESGVQFSLFDDRVKIEKMARLYSVVDMLSEKFGKHTLQHAASLPAKLQAQHEGDRGDIPERKTELVKGENRRQRLGLPMLHIKV